MLEQNSLTGKQRVNPLSNKRKKTYKKKKGKKGGGGGKTKWGLGKKKSLKMYGDEIPNRKPVNKKGTN